MMPAIVTPVIGALRRLVAGRDPRVRAWGVFLLLALLVAFTMMLLEWRTEAAWRADMEWMARRRPLPAGFPAAGLAERCAAVDWQFPHCQQIYLRRQILMVSLNVAEVDQFLLVSAWAAALWFRRDTHRARLGRRAVRVGSAVVGVPLAIAHAGLLFIAAGRLTMLLMSGLPRPLVEAILVEVLILSVCVCARTARPLLAGW